MYTHMVESNPSFEENENEWSSTNSCDDSATSGKRGMYKKKGRAWEDTDEDRMNDVQRGVCKYCKKKVPTDYRMHGTAPFNSHLTKCALNPNNKHSGQAALCLGETETAGREARTAPVNWKFDPEAIRKSIANMIIVDGLPFKFVEGKGFQHFMHTTCPAFKIPSRWTIVRDCYQLYLDEKIKLKHLLKNNASRICLTINSWASIQGINYMCLTAYFIDNDWKLNKRVLNFCPISSHKGSEIENIIVKCLLEWGIDDVFTVTVDNASSNDVAIQCLRSRLQRWGKPVLGGKWIHVRCVAHIVNLIVHDGLRKFRDSIDCIRAAIKYIRQSPSRFKEFKTCVKFERIDCEKLLSLDVPTRWNSTYIMLDTAQRLERAIERFEEENPSMSQALTCLPTKSDWEKARCLVILLENFHKLTVKMSEMKYMTVNNFFSDLSHINWLLNKMAESENDVLSSMARIMKEKYDKYWGRVEKMNMLILISSMLDPRTKFEYLEFVLSKIYGESEGGVVAMLAKDSMFELFNEYKRLNCPLESATPSSTSASCASEKYTVPIDGDADQMMKRYWMEFKKRKIELGEWDKKSELDKYLNEDCEDGDEKFDILLWWKVNSVKFPILSKMARDVLAIPISTVTSESAFSPGERILDAFRSSLTPKIVQALICAQDWLRSSMTELNVEESLEELDIFELGLVKEGLEVTRVDV